MNASERVQKVVFVRHGAAKHNIPDPTTGNSPNKRDPAMTDPSLVHQGKLQALHAGLRLQQWWQATQQGNDVELVITSPLTRCIQTSTLIFFPGDRYTSGTSKEPSFFCTGLCREAIGMHYSDKRSQRSLIMKYWPLLTMDTSMTEFDEAWREDIRETLNELRLRISHFLELLVSRSETNIVVVTHGVWLEQCFRVYCPQVLDHGRRRVYNCDMFAVDCVSKDQKLVRFDNPHKI